MTRPSRYATGVMLLTGVALLGRLIGLDRPPLWRDEAFTAVVVTRDLGPMLDAVRHDSGPPLSYLLAHLVAVVSSSPWALRLMSVVAGTAAVPVAAALARRCAGDRAGWCGAAMVTVMPAFVTSARDARMYALASTLVMLSVLTLWRAVERPSAIRLAAYGVAISAALLTQYFAAIAVAAELATMVVVLRPSRRTVIRVGATAALGAGSLLPWLVAARPQLAHTSSPFWVQPTGINSLLGVLTEFFAGTPVDSGIPGKRLLQTFQAGAIVAGTVATLGLLLNLRRLTAVQRRSVAMLAGCGLGAIVLLVVASLWRPLLEARYASVLWGPLAALLGVGLARLCPQWLAVPAIVGLLGITSIALATTSLHPDAPGAVRYLDGHVRDGDYVSASADTYQLVEYYGGSLTRQRTHITADHVDWYWGTAAYPPHAVLQTIPASVSAQRRTVYLIGPTDVRPPSLPAGYHRVNRSCWTGVCVETYRPL